MEEQLGQQVYLTKSSRASVYKDLADFTLHGNLEEKDARLVVLTGVQQHRKKLK